MIESIKEAIRERETNYPGDDYYYNHPEEAMNDADYWYQACVHLLNNPVYEERPAYIQYLLNEMG